MTDKDFEDYFRNDTQMLENLLKATGGSNRFEGYGGSAAEATVGGLFSQD